MTLARIQVRRDTTTGWAAANPVLSSGEPGFDTTLKQLRIGDGATPWLGLPAATPDGATIAQILATAEAIEGAVAPTDAAMAAALANTSSAARGVLNTTIDEAAGEAAMTKTSGLRQGLAPEGRPLAPAAAAMQPVQAREKLVRRAMRWLGNFWPIGSAGAPQIPTAGSWAADTEYLAPWVVDQTTLVDRIAFRVNTAAAAGATADLTVYAVGGLGRPRSIVYQETGITIDTAGGKNRTVSLDLPPGIYWVGIRLVGTVSGLVLEAAPVNSSPVPLPVTASGTVPTSGITITGLSRAAASTPTAIDLTATLAPAQYVPLVWFRPSIIAAPGRAAWHNADLETVALTNYKQIVTPEHITIEDDPVLGPVRKVVRLNTHDGDTSLTSDPRTQLATYAVLPIGWEGWIGFSLLMPEAPDFPNTWNNSYFCTLHEVFGSPFGGTSPMRLTVVQGGSGLSLALTKTTAFSASGSANVWVLPMSTRRGKWLDFALHVKLSTDPAEGFYELFLNEGDGWAQQALNGVAKLFGASIVAGINNGGANESQIKNYRGAGSGLGDTSVEFASHRVGRTLEEVDPHSYS